MTIAFQPVMTPQDIEQTAKMADSIWHEYFTPLIGEAQVAYMLAKFQSASAITRQIESEHMWYFRIMQDGSIVGYTGIREDADSLFLSKLYIEKSHRGKGLARQTATFLADRCRARQLSKIWLTVNRHNSPTIAAYQKLGFVIVREQVADIGEGFVMDDYIMEMALPLSDEHD